MKMTNGLSFSSGSGLLGSRGSSLSGGGFSLNGGDRGGSISLSLVGG